MAHLRSLTREISHQPIPLYRDIGTKHSIKLDLNSLCIRRPTETFFVQVKNPNLIAWGIDLDDLLIVEKSEELFINDLIVIEKRGEYKFYQFFKEINQEKILFALDASEENIRIQRWEEVNIAGVITNIVHQTRSRIQQRYAV